MKIAGIIAEFNPLHNGHEYLLNKIKKYKFDYIVVIMSPNFVQRGDVAVINKFIRTQAALDVGVDLVLELPVPFALSNAETFAKASIHILENLGIITHLCFGSESGNIKKLKKISKIIEEEDIINLTNKLHKKGITYPKAKQQAITEFYGKKIGNFLDKPNDILAVEYIKNIATINSNIKPIAFKRITTKNAQTTLSKKFTSAACIRDLMYDDFENIANFVPKEAYKLYKNEYIRCTIPSNIKFGERALISKLRELEPKEIIKYNDVSEGLENRICSAIKSSINFEEIINKVKTKRYTRTRIMRIFFNMFLGISADYKHVMPRYVRVLGIKENAKVLLKSIKNTGKLLIITNFKQINSVTGMVRRFLNIEKKATDAYGLFLPKLNICGMRLFAKNHN